MIINYYNLLFIIYYLLKMNQQSLTLTSIEQLADYTHIRKYVSFKYLTENANIEFGNYEGSCMLDQNSVAIREFDVDHMNVRENHQNDTTVLISYILASANSEFELTIAYHSLQDYHRFDIMIIDNMPTLVYYEKFTPKLNEDSKDDKNTTIVNNPDITDEDPNNILNNDIEMANE